MSKGRWIAAIISIIIAATPLYLIYTQGSLFPQDRPKTLLDRLDSDFDLNNKNSLPSNIHIVADTGIDDQFDSNYEGLWMIDEGENSISLKINTNLTKVTPDAGWFPSNPSETCPPKQGVLGKNATAVFCVRSDTNEEGNYSVTYKIYFRPLFSPSIFKTFDIRLRSDPSNPSMPVSDVAAIKMSRDSINVTVVDSTSITTSVVRISLIKR